MADDKEQRTIEIILKAQEANASIKDMGAGAAVMTAQLKKMGQDDPGRAALLADLQSLNQRLRDSNAETRAVVKTQEQLAVEAQAAAAAVEELARANEQTVTSGKLATASLNEMRAAASLMEKELASLSADDPGRAALQQDFATLTTRITATSAAMRTVIKTEAELAEEQRQLTEASERLNQENIQVVVNGQKVAASFDDMKAAAGQLERELGQLSADDPGRAKLIADYRALQERIGEVRTEMGATVPQASLFKQALGFAGVAVTAEAVLDGVVGIGKGIFETTAKFETFGVVLKTALGSESAAQLAMHDIQTMAAKTPFSVDELTSSFIKFVNRGLNPSMAEMTKMADLAASQGKSFDQLTEAVLDAGTGEFERLKEFGIQASKNGDQVSLSFKGVQKTVANTPEAINAALMSFGELNGVMGSTDGISQTLDGSVSNLGDTADQVAIQYGTGLRPVFVAVISTIAAFLGILGALPKFISDNRGTLLALAGALVALNAEQVAFNILLLEEAVRTKAGLVWKAASATATNLWKAAQDALNLSMKANPIGLVISLVMLLVGAFIAVYDKSEKVRAVVAGLGAAFMAFVTTLKNGVLQQLNGIGDLLVGIFTLNPAKIKKGLEEIGGSIKTIYYDAGRNAGAAFSQGYDEKVATEQGKHVGATMEMMAALQTKLLKAAEEASKKRIAAEAAARLESLKGQEADLKVRLAQAEDGSRQEMKLKQQLIAVQAKIELEDAKKTESDKRVIRAEALDKMQDLESDWNKKRDKEREEQRKELAKKAADESKAELAVQHSIEDLRTALIKDKYAREIAEINLQTNRKMAAIKGSEEQQFEQWSLLEQERQDKIAAVNTKRNEDEAKMAEETAAKKADMQAADDELFLAGLQNRVALGLATEQDYQDKLFQLQQEALAMRLQQLVDADQGESLEAKKTRAALLKGQADYVKSSGDQDKKKATQETAMANLSKQINAQGVDDLLSALDKKGAAYEAFIALKKVMAIREVWINLQAETAENRKQAATFPFLLNIAYMVATEALSIANAVSSVAKIAAFAKGGNTRSGGEAVSGMGLLELVKGGGLVTGASGGSFAGGGVVPGAQIGLIGEAGAELVVPNWLFTDPKQANLMGYLEAQIASRGNAFADGGRTMSSAVASTTEPGGEGDSMLELMQQFVKGQKEFRADVNQWQREIEVNLNLVDVKKGLDVVNKVQTGGGLK